MSELTFIQKQASAARKALDSYLQHMTWTEPTDEAIASLLCGLQHLADEYGFRWENRLRAGHDCYAADKAREKVVVDQCNQDKSDV